MDNLSHSIIGWVAGEAVAWLRAPRAVGDEVSRLTPARRRGWLVTLGVVGGNLPDLDLVLTYRGVAADKLAYLLQHRGYTHTVLGCLALALLLYLALEVWARLRHMNLARVERIEFAAMAGGAVLLHLAMDALNSYGVHPFWPWNNRWWYGDSVFIVEPLYWLAAAPLWFVVRSRSTRAGICVIAAAAVAAVVYMHPQQPWSCLVIAALTAAALFVARRAAPRRVALAVVATMLLITAGFALAGRIANQRLARIAAASFPDFQDIDQILAPLPTNPLCWDAWLLQLTGDVYVARHAMLSIAPGSLPADRCPQRLMPVSTTASRATVPRADTAAVQWQGQIVAGRMLLSLLRAQSCTTAALLQFARAPFVAQLAGEWVVGDLRFDREQALGLAETTVGLDSPPCNRLPWRYRVPWVPPRAVLFLPLAP